MKFTAVHKMVLAKAYGFVPPYSMNVWTRRLRSLMFELASWVRETQDPFSRDIVLLDNVRDVAVKFSKSSADQVLVTLVSNSMCEVVDAFDRTARSSEPNSIYRDILYRWATPCTCGVLYCPTSKTPCQCSHGILGILRYNGELTGRCPFTGEPLGCLCGFHPSMFEFVYKKYSRNFLVHTGSECPDFADDLDEPTRTASHRYTLGYTKGLSYVLRLLDERSDPEDIVGYRIVCTAQELPTFEDACGKSRVGSRG